MKIDWDQFRRDEPFRYYFRYKLHEEDFRPAIDAQGRTLGRFYAKPLYGRLDDRGRVDRSAGFNGEIAIAFAEPVEGRLTLRFTHLPKDEIVRADGRKNWPAIREAARGDLRALEGGRLIRDLTSTRLGDGSICGIGSAEPSRPEWCL